MKPKFVLSFLSVATRILMWVLIVFTGFLLCVSILNIVESGKGKRLNSKNYTYEMTAFGEGRAEQPYIYTADSLVRYRNMANKYTVEIEPNSPIGYYSIFMKLIFMGLGIAVLWNFKKIFSETNLDDPFKYSITKRLKVLAALFIVADLLKLTDYFLFNSFLRRSVTTPHLGLITDTGSGIITGLIIWIIAIVYQKGIVLQEENALTV
ncbi:DUF2975 domain-containing protein [Agriterribacter sp.]|uniref:DUF2975 domain-containing protein n=1 Tax=Agriterribacter sp. TaxID=2821509 RepID=UPI002CCC06C3|nr:DUF2975 domain-containing protein [Agriterribacter sp.]HTN08073.1 DUF2975 domain-containing protein [Agriterribacter sp.]